MAQAITLEALAIGLLLSLQSDSREQLVHRLQQSWQATKSLISDSSWGRIPSSERRLREPPLP